MANNTKNGKHSGSNALWNISHYARRYSNDDGSVRGFMISGFQTKEGEDTKYVNIWLPADGAKMMKKPGMKDGECYIAVHIQELTDIVPGAKKDAGDELTEV